MPPGVECESGQMGPVRVERKKEEKTSDDVATQSGEEEAVTK